MKDFATRFVPDPVQALIISMRIAVTVAAYVASLYTPEPFRHIAAFLYHVGAVLTVMAIVGHSEKTFARYLAERMQWIEPKKSKDKPADKPRDSWKGLSPEERKAWDARHPQHAS